MPGFELRAIHERITAVARLLVPFCILHLAKIMSVTLAMDKVAVMEINKKSPSRGKILIIKKIEKEGRYYLKGMLASTHLAFSGDKTFN